MGLGKSLTNHHGAQVKHIFALFFGIFSYLHGAIEHIISLKHALDYNYEGLFITLCKNHYVIFVTTLTLGSHPRQGLARLRAKREAWESHRMLPGM
jgi:hypothetical protein